MLITLIHLYLHVLMNHTKEAYTRHKKVCRKIIDILKKDVKNDTKYHYECNAYTLSSNSNVCGL